MFQKFSNISCFLLMLIINVCVVKRYLPVLTATANRKGVLDVDTVKGCAHGMARYPNGGCYGQCYACKLSTFYGFDFSCSVSRTEINRTTIENAVSKHAASWFRIGTMGDPSHDWDYTVDVCQWLGKTKTPVVITKHWIELSGRHVSALSKCGAVVNTSTSPLDSQEEIDYRLGQFNRLARAGIKSVLRVVTCQFGLVDGWQKRVELQRKLLSNTPVIDNPLRISSTNALVLSGVLITQRHEDLGGG